MGHIERKRDSDPARQWLKAGGGFEALFARLAPQVMGYFVKRGMERNASEELTQEVMLTVWAKADRYDPQRAPLSAWVFTIARNKYVDAYRKRQRPEPDPQDPSFRSTQAVAIPSPEREVDVDRRQRVLSDALSQLPAEQRETLQALYFDGLTMAELADARGVPLGTVKSRARRALQAMRKGLNEEVK